MRLDKKGGPDGLVAFFMKQSLKYVTCDIFLV